MADLLAERKGDLNDEIAHLQNSTLRLKLQQKRGLVERILERIDEVRAML